MLKGFACGEIFVQHPLEVAQNLGVDHVARDELAVVEAHAVVEQQLYVADYQLSAVAVDGVLEFLADVAEAVLEHLALAFGEVQRLVGQIVEEAETVDVARQFGAANQVGVEDQPEAFGRRPVVGHGVEADGLARRKADHRALLIVVGAAAVEDGAAHRLLEEQRVDAIVDGAAHGERPAVLHVDDAHQRMQRLEAVQVVVGLHRVEHYVFSVVHRLTLVFMCSAML